MMVTFFDRQEEKNPLNGSSYNDPKAIIETLTALTSRLPFFCEIEAENGFKLLVGVDSNWSCIQYSAIDGSPPYLMAVPKDGQIGSHDMDFLIGNTPTPIAKDYILNVELAKDVISFFAETGRKSQIVDWEEI